MVATAGLLLFQVTDLSVASVGNTVAVKVIPVSLVFISKVDLLRRTDVTGTVEAELLSLLETLSEETSLEAERELGLSWLRELCSEEASLDAEEKTLESLWLIVLGAFPEHPASENAINSPRTNSGLCMH